MIDKAISHPLLFHYLGRRMALHAISKISDYALIGDARCAALVSNAGSIDWLCLPRFDSPSVFNRLLDALRGGYFAIHPTIHFSTHRRYIHDTNLLITEFHTRTGVVRLTDFMPVLTEEEKREIFMPFRSIIRIVEGMEGTVEMEMECLPRPEDGQYIPTFKRRGREGYFADIDGGLFHLASDRPLERMHEKLSGRWTIGAGGRSVFWLAYSKEAPAIYPRIDGRVEDLKERSIRYWRAWAGRCNYRGPYRDAVVRSALTLKLLSFAPSNAIVAAPTTSLPEALGSNRNWDYRYCWLRDASYTAQAFFRLGYREEAAGFVQWLLHATRLTQPALKVVYDVYGRLGIRQREVD